MFHIFFTFFSHFFHIFFTFFSHFFVKFLSNFCQICGRLSRFLGTHPGFV
jgi:hypothetical protein